MDDKRSVTHATFVVERSYHASPARVFRAFADPAVKARWFGGADDWSGPQTAFDFRVGGRERHLARAFWRSADHWIADFLRGVPKCVVSRSLEQVDWNNSRIIRDLPGDVEKLKQEPGKAIFVAGSAHLIGSLIRHGLVDEYRVMVNPILLGAGTPLFQGGFDRKPLRLVGRRQLSSGLVILRYRVR